MLRSLFNILNRQRYILNRFSKVYRVFLHDKKRDRFIFNYENVIIAANFRIVR